MPSLNFEISAIEVGGDTYSLRDTSKVRYDKSMSLTDTQKAQARSNIGAGTYSKPSGGIPDSDIASASTWNGKYTKPSGGIPASDLAESYYLSSNPNGYTSNTGTVIGSDLTADRFVLGNGTVNVKKSTYAPGPSSTTWSDSSDMYLPTMKAVSDFVYANYVHRVTDGTAKRLYGVAYSEAHGLYENMYTIGSDIGQIVQRDAHGHISLPNQSTYAPSDDQAVSKRWVEAKGYTTNTGTVIGSSLTANKLILGNGGVNIKNSTYEPGTSSMTWDNASDVYLPTMKAVSNYVLGRSYIYNASATGDGLTVAKTTDVHDRDVLEIGLDDNYISGGSVSSSNKLVTEGALPTMYLKSASVSGNTLTLTKQDNGTVTYTPSFTDKYHTSGSWSGLTYTATANGGAGALALTIPTGDSTSTSADLVVKCNDSRLSNSRPASDVYSWAKAATKPSYTLDEVTDGTTRKLSNYLPLTGGNVTGDLVLYVASGNSPRLTFQRGTLSDSYNDWSLYDGSGYLYIQQRGSGSSSWETRATFDQSGVNFVGSISEDGTTLANKYLGKSAKAADSAKLNGQDASYYQAALPTTSTAGKVLKSTSTAGTVEWADDSNTNTWRNIKVDGTEKIGTGTGTGALNFVSQNTNNGDITFTYDNGIKATAKFPTLATVATSGSYGDLSNKPTIPATNVIPATTTGDKLLVSTTTSGTAKWSDWSTAGFVKTNASGVVSIDTNTYLTSHQSIKSLDTTATAAQSTSSSEAIKGSGTITLHKIAKTGTYSDLIGKPTIPATNVIPATTTANKMLVSTTTSGTAKWSDWSSAGFLKTDASGVISVDTNSYLTTSGTAADSSKLNGQAASYYAKATDIPSAYIKSASSSGNTLTLTKQDNTTVVYTPSFTDANYYHTPSYSSGLKIATGTGVNDLYVPTGTGAEQIVQRTTNGQITLPDQSTYTPGTDQAVSARWVGAQGFVKSATSSIYGSGGVDVSINTSHQNRVDISLDSSYIKGTLSTSNKLITASEIPILYRHNLEWVFRSGSSSSSYIYTHFYAYLITNSSTAYTYSTYFGSITTLFKKTVLCGGLYDYSSQEDYGYDGIITLWRPNYSKSGNLNGVYIRYIREQDTAWNVSTYITSSTTPYSFTDTVETL